MEQWDKGTRRPCAQDYQGEQEELKTLRREHQEITKKKGIEWRGEQEERNKNPLTHSNPQLPISSYHKESEEQEDKETRRPGTQDKQREQKENNHVSWETRRKEQDDNKKKGTCFKPSSPQF